MTPTQDAGDDEVLTLEPLLEAVRTGIEGAGWDLSGMQKTTSYRFEGRWEGDSTRSAYLFFHRDGFPDHVSIDVYLDETSRGLKGNVALVLDGPRAGRVSSVVEVLKRLAPPASKHLDAGLRRPLTLRFRMGDVDGDAGEAGSEIRFKAHIPSAEIEKGADAVEATVEAVARSFEDLFLDADIRRSVGLDEGS